MKNTNEEKTKLKEEKSSMKKIIDGHPKLLEIATRKAREEALKEKILDIAHIIGSGRRKPAVVKMLNWVSHLRKEAVSRPC